MATNSTLNTVSFIRRGTFLAVAAIALAACGGDPDPVASETIIYEAVTAQPEAVAVTAVTEAPTTTASVETTTTVAEATTTTTTTSIPAPTTTVVTPAPETTTTTEAPATMTRPEDVGAVASDEHGFMVVTSADDPLNVRLGPGVRFDAIDQLEHRTTGISTAYTVELASSGPWAFVEVDGEELGWVHAGFLQRFGHSATCSRFGPTNKDASLVLSTEADVDQDGAIDQVEVFTAQFTPQTALMWIEIAFANGGTTAGIAAETNSVVHFPGVNDLRIGRLQYLPHDGPLEISVKTEQGASHSGWAVLTLDNCELVPTTLGGNPFGYAVGASAIASSVSCSFGAHGELTFSTTVSYFNDNESIANSFELRGTEWSHVGSINGEAIPEPTAVISATCPGA